MYGVLKKNRPTFALEISKQSILKSFSLNTQQILNYFIILCFPNTFLSNRYMQGYNQKECLAVHLLLLEVEN